MSIPNTLTIYLNTRIPGHQKIKYKPSMTNPKINPNMDKIYFNPLIKLTKSAINEVPPNVKQNQFFEKGLFYTLESRVLTSFFGAQKKDNQPPLVRMKLSKDNGILDENIRLTLDTLFKPETVIYIDKKPYTIYNYYWDSGNWKIDTNTSLPSFLGNYGYGGPGYGYRGPGSGYGGPSPIIINVGNQGSPYAMQNSLANKELKEIPQELVSGDEYNDEEFNDIPSIHPPEWNPSISTFKMIENRGFGSTGGKTLESSAPPLAIARPIYPPLPPPSSTGRGLLPLPPPSGATGMKLLPPPPPGATGMKLLPPPPGATGVVSSSWFKIPKIFKGATGSTGSTGSTGATGSTGSSGSSGFKMPKIFKGGAPIVIRDRRDTNQSYLRKYFTEYYPLIKVIYFKLPPTLKKFILPPVRSPDVPLANYTIQYFRNIVQQLQILQVAGDGNCFFHCIAQAFNNYNAKYPDPTMRIEYKGIYNFDQLDVRNIIVEYFQINKSRLNELMSMAQARCIEMNHMLDNLGVITDISVLQYNIDQIFDEQNFIFIEKPTVGSSSNLIFTVTDSPFEYIRSHRYWGDETTAQILQIMIKIKIITIQNESDDIFCPFANLTDSQPSLSGEEWDKYLFVYHQGLHYDLVEFSNTAIFFRNPYVTIYPTRLSGKTYPQTAAEGIEYQKYIIDNNLIPPIYIILFLYGFFYTRLSEDKSGIHTELFNDYFIVLDNAYTTISRNIIEYRSGNTDAIPEGPNKAAELNFLNLFNTIFGGTTPPRPDPFSPVTGSVGATGAGVTGAGVTVAGVTVAGVTAAGLTAAGVTAAGVTGAGVTAAGVTTAAVTGAAVTGASVTGARPSSVASGVASGIRNYASPISGDSKTTYIVFVELEIYPGKEIPANKKISLGCNRKFEGIRKSWAELRGFQYRTVPLNYYDGAEKRINPSFKSQTVKNMSTRKSFPYKGGKSKTCKNKKA